MQDFDQFWAVYPRKVNKGDARKAWMQTASIRPPLDVLLAAVEKGKQSVQWHKADREGTIGAFIPYPASYLRAEGWENEYTVRLSSIKTAEPTKAEPVEKPSAEQIEKARQLLAEVRLRRVA